MTISRAPSCAPFVRPSGRRTIRIGPLETLRHEYDKQLLDPAQRAQRARRLHTALRAAGLWRGQMRLLDVGCGSGLLLAALGEDPRQRVGCDVRRALYLEAQARAGGVLFAQADATSLPFRDGAFDLVTCLAVIAECVDWQGALQEMARCVAPGGTLCVTVTNGPLVRVLYASLARLGWSVRASAREYGVAGQRLIEARPEVGFGLATLATWRYIHLTPHLARSHWSWLHLLPLHLLHRVAPHVAPSFGFAWQRPADPARPK